MISFGVLTAFCVFVLLAFSLCNDWYHWVVISRMLTSMYSIYSICLVTIKANSPTIYCKKIGEKFCICWVMCFLGHQRLVVFKRFAAGLSVFQLFELLVSTWPDNF